MKNVIMFFAIVAACTVVIILQQKGYFNSAVAEIITLAIFIGGATIVAKRFEKGRKDA